MRLARILAFLLALVTFAISAYLFKEAPSSALHLAPANLGMVISLFFWRVAPAKKKARRRAALASVVVIPCMLGSGALGMLLSPISDWPVFVALALLATMIAIFALLRVKRKQSHPWADYYTETT